MREYETIYIVRPDATEDMVAGTAARLRGAVEKTEGKVLQIKSWGKRKLAYEVRKQLKGIYIYSRYLGEQDLVAEVERTLRMIEAVIKYQTVKLGEGVDPDSREAEEDDLGANMDEEAVEAALTSPDAAAMMEPPTYSKPTEAPAAPEAVAPKPEAEADAVTPKPEAEADAVTPKPEAEAEAEPEANAEAERADDEPEKPEVE